MSATPEATGGQELVQPPPEHCPGTQSEHAGQASACEGCPNQKICSTAPKGPDPGNYNYTANPVLKITIIITKNIQINYLFNLIYTIRYSIDR